MSAVGQKLREAHEALVRAREALEEARLWFPVGGVAAPALLVLQAEVKALTTRLGTCAGEFYFHGWLTPADVDTAPAAVRVSFPEGPLEVMKRAIQERAEAEYRARIANIGAGGLKVAEVDEAEPADLEDVEARTEALLPDVLCDCGAKAHPGSGLCGVGEEQQ